MPHFLFGGAGHCNLRKYPPQVAQTALAMHSVFLLLNKHKQSLPWVQICPFSAGFAYCVLPCVVRIYDSSIPWRSELGVNFVDATGGG